MKNDLPIMSVSGIRGTMNETIFPHLFSIVSYIQTLQAGGGKILVGRDTRPSGEILAQAAFRGIRCAGGIPVDIGIAPTPTTCFATGHFKAAGGIIITASHNPLPYNGYKMVHSSGRLFSGSECSEIYDRFNNHEYPTHDELLKYSDTPELFLDAVTPHIEAIVSAVDTDRIKKCGIQIAIDAINGAAGVIFPKLLDKLSVSWKGVNTELSGNFTHNPEPRPEHLEELAHLLKSDPAFWGGFAFDPDADRLAMMGEHGEPLSEEMTLALACENVLAKKQSDIVTNLSTSMVIEDVARQYNVKVIRTKIGEANVVEDMHKHNTAIGGEGNGGVIYPSISTVRDGLCGIALILELMATTGKRLIELTGRWPTYPIVKEKIVLGNLNPTEVIRNLTELFSSETTDLQDGLKIIRENGWVHVRPSNTEPILRCYAEAKTSGQARELADMVMEKILPKKI